MSNGLTKSSPVFADGFRVGIVRDLLLRLYPTGQSRCQIDVDPELRIPKGSTAELAAEMLGGVKMNLLLPITHGRNTRWDTIPGVLNNGMMEKVANYDAASREDAAQAGFHPRILKCHTTPTPPSLQPCITYKI